MSNQPKTGKRIQIYLAARHAEWWNTLPRWERSRIVAESLDLYRAQNDPKNSDTSAHNSADFSTPDQDAEK